ncbi:MAG TPA: metalloregulator ArsR/SmtB family transcription factor [Candidatus Limnocylindria bacterium]
MAPTRRPGDSPLITIDPAPAYEMLQALAAVLDEDDADTYDIGAEWFAEIRDRAGTELMAQIGAISFGVADTFTHLMGIAYETPSPRDVPAFLEHLRATDPDEIRLHLVEYYTRDARRTTPAAVMRAAVAGDADARAEFLRTSHPEYEPWTHFLQSVLDADGPELKRALVDALEAWHDRVWKAETLTITPILDRDADAKRVALSEQTIDDFVRNATNGVEFVARPGIERLVMIPSFVRRPLVAYAEFAETQLIVFPVADESVTAETDEPPRRLVRLSKALGDEKRLRVLRALADGDMTLMELADMFGVAKTTMHHHMIVLRSAGLVSVGVGQKRYRLRREALPDVGGLLGAYLTAEESPAAGSPARTSPSRRRASSG